MKGRLATITTVLGVPTTGPLPIVIERAGRAELLQLFGALNFRRGAEIGVWSGGFSEKICRALPGVDLMAIDPWSPYAEYREKKNDPVATERAYQEAVARLTPYACTLVRKTSIEAAKEIPDASLDFIYLDANHERSFVLEDLRAWTPKVRQGGIIAGHDYRDVPTKPYIQVKGAIDEFTASTGISPWFVLAAERTPSFFWVVER